MERKVLFVIAQENFRDQELEIPLTALKRRGCPVLIAAPELHEAVGSQGLRVKPDISFNAIEPYEYSAIVVIGGKGSLQLCNELELLRVIEYMYRAGKIVAAQCSGVAVLACAGILLGKRVTGWYDEEDAVRSRGAEYTGLPVEVDGNIITSREASTAQDFSNALLFALHL